MQQSASGCRAHAHAYVTHMHIHMHMHAHMHMHMHMQTCVRCLLVLNSFGGFGGAGYGSAYGSTPTITPITPLRTHDAVDVALLQTQLSHVTLPYLTTHEHVALHGVINTWATLSELERTLDPYAQRYMSVVMMWQHMRVSQPQLALSTASITHALHSTSTDTLLSLTIGAQSSLSEDDLTWEYMRAMGMGYWLSGVLLQETCLRLAGCQFRKRKNPNDCLLMYLVRHTTRIIQQHNTTCGNAWEGSVTSVVNVCITTGIPRRH